MAWLGALAALGLIVIVLVDTFEAIVLPRRVRHAFRLGRLFYHSTWLGWKALALRFPVGRWRGAVLSIFGPLSLLALLVVWATGLVIGFALLHWSLGTAMAQSYGADAGLTTYLYFSGTTFFTLGYGDLVPVGPFGRALSVIEAGLGFAFLAIVISYLPVLYQAFSRREITISLLDARAGSPPTAGELLRRMADVRSLAPLAPLLAEWERWSAELLESHLSFPVLRFYRSQHDNQSWLATLTMILDTTAVLTAGGDPKCSHAARLTFAMARHTAVDLVLVSRVPPRSPKVDRLSASELTQLLEVLRRAGLEVRDEATVARALAELRSLYEPFICALSEHLLFVLPPFVPAQPPVDNWQTSPGMPRSPGLSDLQAAGAHDEHAD